MENLSVYKPAASRCHLPVELRQAGPDRFEFTAGGETVHFTGTLCGCISDHEMVSEPVREESPFITLNFAFTAKEDLFLREVRWLDGAFDDEGVSVKKHSTNLNDNFLFLRKNKVSFLFSLDFPSSRIDGTTISYLPYCTVKKGGVYRPHSLTVTACTLSGNWMGEWDANEVEAASAYIEHRFPIRFDRPMNLTTCITNRLTYTQEGMVYYSMQDNPTLALDIDTLYEEVDLCDELLIEYYQVFEGVYDWPADDGEISRRLKDLVAYAKSKGIKVGDYVHPGEMYCPHYNYERRYADVPQWRIKLQSGEEGQFCLGCDEYREQLIQTLAAHNEKHGEKLICLDMIDMEPCFNEKHNHALGDVYKQVLGLVELMERLSALSKDYMIWTNSGNWIEFMPKLVWYNPNIYLTDPHPREYVPTLNSLKYLGDCRREQMVTVHEKYMVPYRFYTNCEYYFSPRSRISDVRTYEYSLLQSLAVTPNVCFGELRVFLNRLPHKAVPQFKAFVKKWLSFIRDNYACWKNTLRCGDAPGVDAAEIYSHMDGDSGYLCLVNQNIYPVYQEIRLDASIGLTGGERFELSEVYPEEYLLNECGIPYVLYGETLKFTLKPESVRYLRIQPYRQRDGIVVYGAPADISHTDTGYRLSMKGQQGTTRSIAIACGEEIEALHAMQRPTVAMYTFDAAARITDRFGQLIRADITFPRRPAVTGLYSWTRENGEELSLPLDDFGFQGGLVSGSFSEELEVYVDVVTCPDKPVTASGKSHCIASELPVRKKLPHQKKETLTARFFVPFIESTGFGMRPGYDDDCLVQLAFQDVSKIERIACTLNGRSVPVKKYHNMMNKDWYTYYVELTDHIDCGEVEMILTIEWIS